MNCNHQDESGNFCGQCGVALREKCSECGEVYIVSKLRIEAEQAESEYVGNKRATAVMILFFGQTVIFIVSLIALGWMPTVIISLCSIVASSCFVARNLPKKWHDDFLKKFPKYAEIFKQAEEGKVDWMNTFVRGPKPPHN